MLSVICPRLLWAEPHRHAPPPLSLTHTHSQCVSRGKWLRQMSEREHVCSLAVTPAEMSWDCGLKYLFSLQQAGVCALRAPDDFSRLEMVQRLAKDGYHFLQNQNYRVPDRSAQVGRPSLAGQGSNSADINLLRCFWNTSGVLLMK